MSTCPEKDIHSIYIDRELPEIYLEKYEEHVKNCPSCQEELSKLRFLKQEFKKDSESLEKSQEEIDSSYERLLTRLSYSKVTNKNPKGKIKTLSFSSNFRAYWKYITGGVAAAAVLALLLPVKNTVLNKNNSQNQNFRPIARTEMLYPSNTQVHYDKALSGANFAATFGNHGNSSPKRNSPETDYSALQDFSPVSNVSMTNQNLSGINRKMPYQERYAFSGNFPARPPFMAEDFSSLLQSDLSEEKAEQFLSTMTSYDVFNPMRTREGFFSQNTEGAPKGFSVNLYSNQGLLPLETGLSK